MNKKNCFLLVNHKGYLLLNSLIKEHIFPDLVITYKDQNSSCNSYEKIINLCESNNIEFIKERKFDEYKLSQQFKYIFVIGWQFMLKVQNNIVVIHDSYLPEFKGFSPTINYLIEGYNYLAITAFRPTDKVDTGPIYYQKKLPIQYPIKLEQAFEKLNTIYVNAIKYIINNQSLQLEELDHSKESFCSWRTQDDMNINWNWSIQKIKRFIDALGFPYSGAKSYYFDGKQKYTIIIKDAIIEDNVNIVDRDTHLGKVFSINDNKPSIISQDGLLRITNYEFFGYEDKKIQKLKSKFI